MYIICPSVEKKHIYFLVNPILLHNTLTKINSYYYSSLLNLVIYLFKGVNLYVGVHTCPSIGKKTQLLFG